MLEQLKKDVFNANLALVKHSLVILTWGNVSAIERETGLIVIKPSGVSYDDMTSDDMVVVDLSGKIIEGNYKPSSDTATHIELYKAFKTIGGVVHTHSTNATAFAQAGCDITAFGTTHADYFFGNIPCVRRLTESEIESDYEKNTGVVIAEAYAQLDYDAVPACVVQSHGAFTWGKDCAKAVENAIVLEECAKMALLTQKINDKTQKIPQHLLNKHYLRKHGKNAYYGQSTDK